MLESFSTQAIKIIEDAKSIASNLNSKVVGSEHLLLALYQAKDSICRFLLQEKNISYENLLDALNNITVIHKCEDKEIKFTDKFQEIILKTEELIKEVDSNYVFDEHIFYAMLEDASNVGVEILNLLGLNITELMEDIEDIFSFFDDEIEDNTYPYLTNLSKKEIVHPFIKRDNYIERINYILDKKQKNNPLLIGTAGVGKTAIIEGLAKIRTKDIIFQLDLGATISGTKYRGELEEKILKAMEYVKEQNAILFIDEIHNVVGAGSNDGSLDIANILKPYLSRNDISIIGATTLEEYYKFIDKDKALMRRFQPLFISEPSIKETKEILSGIKLSYESFHNVNIPNNILDLIIDKTNIYVPQRSFPDKAIDVLDEIGARKKYDKYKNLSLETLVDDVIKDTTNINVIDKDTIKKIDLNYNILKQYYLRFSSRFKEYPNIFTYMVEENFNPRYLIEDLFKIFKFKEEMYLEIDLNNYSDPTMMSNLLGSSKGYVGYDQGGILSEHILKYPISLIYFKNYEKAHNQIKIVLEKIMNNSFFIDNKGRKINLQNTMFIFDSANTNKNLGFILNNKNDTIKTNYLKSITKEENKDIYIKLLNKYNISITNIQNVSIDVLDKIVFKLLLEDSGEYYIVDSNTYYLNQKNLVLIN